uniref:Zgc:195282 n=1 Tax=Sphaeramia orbicularis TaxID=375764 RepID=A0A673BBR7_9TELE
HCALWPICTDKREKKRSLGRDYHPLCLKCQKCSRQLTAGQHAEYDEKPYCSYCYLKMFGPRGTVSSGWRRSHFSSIITCNKL